MYSQFFGSFLLRRGAITPEDLAEATNRLKNSKIKLGTLAIHQGLMVASEVEEIYAAQMHEDAKFGEIAIKRGYLSADQVDELLHLQVPDYLAFGQNLVDADAITYEELQSLMVEYESIHEIADLDYNVESKAKVIGLIERLFEASNIPVNDHTTMYIELLFNNIVRFVGDDFTPLTPIPCFEYPASICVSQSPKGDATCASYIDMKEDVAVEFASRYGTKQFTKLDEEAKASLKGFLDLHNNLFASSMLSNYGKNVDLDAPIIIEDESIKLEHSSFTIPIIFSFGIVNIITCLYK